METIRDLLVRHPFFERLNPEYIDLLSGCGVNVHFDAGQFIFREGEDANYFYILREGRVGLDIHVPARGAVRFETLEGGDVLGVSWLTPPYRWMFDAQAVLAVRATALDAKCLRAKCEQDPRLGYELMKTFAGLMAERLQTARLRLIEMYSHPEK